MLSRPKNSDGRGKNGKSTRGHSEIDCRENARMNSLCELRAAGFVQPLSCGAAKNPSLGRAALRFRKKATPREQQSKARAGDANHARNGVTRDLHARNMSSTCAPFDWLATSFGGPFAAACASAAFDSEGG